MYLVLSIWIPKLFSKYARLSGYLPVIAYEEITARRILCSSIRKPSASLEVSACFSPKTIIDIIAIVNTIGSNRLRIIPHVLFL